MKKRIFSILLSIIIALSMIPPFTAFAADYATELKNKGFPDTYITALVALHNKYPNWKFEVLDTKEDWSTAVSKERATHKQQLIQNISSNNNKGYYCTCSLCYKNGKYVIQEGSTWVSASQTAVEYYMDPRNFLDEVYIFQFESNEYQSSHTQEGVEGIIATTWMKNANITYKDENGETVTYSPATKYSAAIMTAAKNSGLGAYYIASKIVQEVGGTTNSAPGASGTYSGYPGIYNYYSIGASSGAADGIVWAAGGYKWHYVSATVDGKTYTGYIREDLVDVSNNTYTTNSNCNMRSGPSTSTASVLESGKTIPKGTKLTYIRTDATTDKVDYGRPWTNPYLSIINGALWIADNYKNQNTGYLQKFNVNPASGSSMHAHEYMTNVQAAASEASNTYKGYQNAGVLAAEKTFKIPVFKNMPSGLLETPQITSLNSENSGVQISWGKISGAENYRVYRKTASTSWTALGTTTSTSFTDTTASKGIKYTYTIRCVSKDGKSYTSNYDTTGKSITVLSVPSFSSVSNGATGVQISWGQVSGAGNYRLYRKTASTSWVALVTTASTSFTDTTAKSGTKYTYTVRCMSADGKSFTSGYSTTGKSITFISAPNVSSVSAESTGALIKWNAVTGAENYKVYRKTASTSWTALGTTTSTSFTDKTAKSGTKYTYTVRCVNKSGSSYTSGYNSGMSIDFISAPVISSLSNGATGVQISWGKVSGAANYRLYRKTASTSWVALTTTSSTSFTDKTAVSGTKYTYTVRCMSADAKSFTSGYDSAGKSITFISAPVLTSVAAENAGVVIKWNASKGAVNYKVYRKTAGTSWTALSTTTSTSFTDKTAKSGTAYTYTVRCVSKDGKSYTSGYDSTGKSLTTLSVPKISSISPTLNGVQISWGQISGAANYRLYRKTASTSWVALVTTSSTSFTDTTAKSGTAYTYTVRCMSADGKTFTSGYDATGKSITYLSAPNISSVSSEATGALIKWSAVTGAVNYKVYRKTGSSGWVALGTTTSTSFTDKTATSGTTYTYTVRCISKDGKSYTSGYNAGMSLTFISAPKVSSIAPAATGVQISWGKVAGAENYRLYRKTASTSWVAIVTTSSTSYTDTTAKTGTTYTYTLRCMTADAKTFTSSYDSAGKSVTYLAVPKISSISADNTGTQISWGKISGAENYKVYRKTASTSWTAIGTTTSTSFTDKTAAKGTNYTYTVRCVSKNGSTYTSGYDSTGKSITALSVPTISSIANGATGVQITWGKVSGAGNYRLYRKTASTSWTAIVTTDSTSYTDTTAKSGTEYTYTLRCMSADAKTFTSGYNTTGKSITFISAPKISSISAESTGIQIKWSAVTGAVNYRVYRKTGSESWTAIGTTAYTNFTDIQAKKGTTYTYTIRCVNKSGSAFTSGYDTTGKSIASISSPITQNDMVQLANTQLGNSGGKKFWTWAGYKSRVPWCNIFVAWCANQLGYLQSGRVPLYQSPTDTANWYKAKGLFKDKSYIPKPGDLIFLKLNDATTPYHIGIVEKYENGTIYTIEGNLNDAVTRRNFPHSYKNVFGYATPDYGHN